jgi:hypothetical protein
VERKGIECHHSINSRSCGSFFLRFTPWVAPLLPTEGIYLENYLKPQRNLGQRKGLTLAVTMVE